jgi:hypothetical protein
MKRSSLIALALLSCAVVATISLRWNQENPHTAGVAMPSQSGSPRSVSRSGGSMDSIPAQGKTALSSERTKAASPSREATAAAAKNVSNQADFSAHAANSRSRSRSHKKSAADSAAAPEARETETREVPDEEAPSPLGVRLASNVRLPAAAMPNDLKLTDISRKALQEIVDDYYRELAVGIVPQEEATDPEMNPSQTGQVETADNGDRTMIVTNGPVAEAARKRADQRFRALFGSAAYNRITMNAQMELLMSADAGR